MGIVVAGVWGISRQSVGVSVSSLLCGPCSSTVSPMNVGAMRRLEHLHKSDSKWRIQPLGVGMLVVVVHVSAFSHCIDQSAAENTSDEVRLIKMWSKLLVGTFCYWYTFPHHRDTPYSCRLQHRTPRQSNLHL